MITGIVGGILASKPHENDRQLLKSRELQSKRTKAEVSESVGWAQRRDILSAVPPINLVS